MVGVRDEDASAWRNGKLAGCEQRAMLFARKQTHTRIELVRFSHLARRNGKRERWVLHLRMIKDKIREEDQVEERMRAAVWVCGIWE